MKSKARLFSLGILVLSIFIAGCISSGPSDYSKTQSTKAATYEEKIPVKFEACTLYTGEKLSAADLKAFNNPEVAYTVNYPSEWHYEIFLGTATFRPTEKKVPFAEIFTEGSWGVAYKGENPTLETFTPFYINKKLVYDSGVDKLEESCTTTFLGQPAYKVVYNLYLDAEKPNVFTKSLGVWTVKNGEVYMLSYRADSRDFDANLPGVYAILDSLQLK